MKCINECEGVVGKYVIVRSSCNVPIVDGVVTNEYRLLQALPTLIYLREQGARVIIVAHIGRNDVDTLKPVYDALQKHLPMSWGGPITESSFSDIRNSMKNGDIVMTENIRQDRREVDNDPTLAGEIAMYGDIYVNDAFDNVHREHATMVALPTLLPNYAGITLMSEVAAVSKAMTPQHPSLFIIGGAKFETKIPLVEKYLERYDFVFVGGALAHDILKADGYEVGQSLVSDVSLADHPMLKNKKLLRPFDVVVTRDGATKSVLVGEVQQSDVILDMGERTVAILTPYIKKAKSILWNGPLGKYESGIDGSTQAVARLIASAEAHSVLGGGDTVAAVEDLGLNDNFGHVSTGGGAMLTLLEEGTTPALSALGYMPV